MPPRPSAPGTAAQQGRLWGARAEGWAEYEEQEVGRFAAALERVEIAPGDAVLDVGCGSGVFLRLAAGRGAHVFGLDASQELIEIAGRRVPEADLRVGDIQSLPYEDDRFDLVAGFSSFFFAADMTEALGEAGRVAKPGASVVIQVWGRPERCDLTPILGAVRALRPAPTTFAPLWEPGRLERMATDAGLAPQERFDVSVAVESPDEVTLLRWLLSAGGVVAAIEHSGEDAVSRAILERAAPFRTADGGFRLENEWTYLIAASRS
jgi:SAM-dependent methyltransferase